MTINEIIILIIQSLIIPLATWGLAMLRTYLLAKAKDARIQSAILLADSAIAAAVGEVGQVFVDELKKDDAFTAEHAQEAFEMASDRVKKILGDGGIALLVQATGDANAYITAKIEELVRETKVPTALIADAGLCALTD